MVSVVMTQKMTGTPDDIAAFSAPLVAPLTTASKCAVAPRTCAARQGPSACSGQAAEYYTLKGSSTKPPWQAMQPPLHLCPQRLPNWVFLNRAQLQSDAVPN